MLRIKKPITFTAAFLVASFLLFVSAQPLLQEGMPPSPKSEEHDWLAADAGVWDAQCTMSSPMGDMEFKGTETVTVDLGGLWTFSTFEAELMGQPFKGRSVNGYDPDTKKFVGAWVDSMTPRLVTSEGERVDGVLTMHAVGKDMVTGEPQKEKQVLRHEGKDKRIFEMFVVREDGDELMMKIVYTRKAK